MDLLVERFEFVERNLILPVAWEFLAFKFFPHEPPWTVVDFFEGSVLEDPNDDGKLRFVPKGYGLALSCLDFDFGSIRSNCIEAFVGSCFEFETIGVSDKAFSNATDHMSVWSEVAPWVELFEFSNGRIKLLN